MPKKPSNQDSSWKPRPEIEPIPGDVPKKSPKGPEPLSTSSPEYSPGEEGNSPSDADSDSEGEDHLVESGLPDDDPEVPRETDEEQSDQ